MRNALGGMQNNQEKGSAGLESRRKLKARPPLDGWFPSVLHQLTDTNRPSCFCRHKVPARKPFVKAVSIRELQRDDNAAADGDPLCWDRLHQAADVVCRN